MEKEKLKKIEKVSEDFFDRLGMKVKLALEELEGAVKIKVEGEDLGILIGHHGETLDSLQLLLTLIVNKELGEESWQRIVLDVGSWRNEREEALKKLTDEAAKKASKEGSAALPPMNSSERRFVHLFLEAYPQLTSHSEDEGINRHIVITTKSE